MKAIPIAFGSPQAMPDDDRSPDKSGPGKQ
jgi:hypothetical protein